MFFLFPFCLFGDAAFFFRMVFLSLVLTTDWIFDISSCENSINQSINEGKTIATLLRTDEKEKWLSSPSSICKTSVLGRVSFSLLLLPFFTTILYYTIPWSVFFPNPRFLIIFFFKDTLSALSQNKVKTS